MNYIQKYQLINESIVLSESFSILQTTLKIAKNAGEKLGLNIKHIDLSLKKISATIDSESKQHKTSKISDSAKKVTSVTLKEIKKNLDPSIVGKKASIALALIVGVIIVQSLLVAVITSIITKSMLRKSSSKDELDIIQEAANIAMVVGATVIAPIFEELMKKYAIDKKVPWLTTTIFNMYEFITYRMLIKSVGGKELKTIALRGSTVLMHYLTTYVQKRFVEKDKPKTGYAIAVTIHAAWNIAAVLLNDKIMGWVVK